MIFVHTTTAFYKNNIDKKKRRGEFQPKKSLRFSKYDKKISKFEKSIICKKKNLKFPWIFEKISEANLNISELDKLQNSNSVFLFSGKFLRFFFNGNLLIFFSIYNGPNTPLH